MALLPAVFLIATFVLPDFLALRRGQRVDGVVHYIDPANHWTVYYGYQFNGKTYQASSQGGAGFGNPPFDSLKAGTRIQLWVDPQNPATGLPGDPGPSLVSNLMFVIPAYFLIVFFLYRSFDSLPDFLRLGQD